MNGWIPVVPQEQDKTEPSYFGVDRSSVGRLRQESASRNGFFRRVWIVARELPRMIRDAWRDSRYPYEGKVSTYGNFFAKEPTR